MVSSIFLNKVYLTNWSSTSSILGQFFSLIAIFIFVLLLTYFTTKFLASHKFRSNSKGNISIIETVSVGTSNILILKVSEQYFLVSSSKDGIRLIAELNEPILFENNSGNLNVNKQKFMEYFNAHLGKFKNKGGK